MPRKADPVLEGRILESAHRLWLRGGDEALSMRAVAKAARTNTPAIYRRFRNRKEILRTLVRKAQHELFAVLEPCRSPFELASQTLEFALAHRREYELLTAGLLSRLNEPQPNLEFVAQRCAEWMGGTAEDQTAFVLAIWSLVHGTAMLLITRTIASRREEEVRNAFSTALQVLVNNQSAFKKRESDVLGWK